MTDINPCPKCGGKAELIANRALSMRGYYVVCLDCFKRTALCDTQEEAIASWNEETTPLTDGSGDKRMNAQLVFCCNDMTQLLASGEIRLQRNQDGGLIATIGSSGHHIPLNYCPSCGRLFRLTFLADSGVME